MSIRETITLDNSDYKRTVKETERLQDRYTDKQKRNYRETGNAAEKSSKKTQSSFKKMGQSAKYWLAGVAAGAAAGLIAVVKNIGGEVLRFNQELNKSFAIQGGLTEDQKERMSDAAKEVAADLNIATDKIAEGYYFLASAGLTAEQQIANLPQVAKFAKAGMFDLATATDLATDAQSALGLTVEDTRQNQQNLARVTDVLTKANTVANASIQQFSESLTNKAATRLRQYNKDIEEGAALLAVYADQGIKGRLAGERLNILFRELARASRENAAAFEQAGIAVFDASGRMRNSADIIADLETAFEGLSDQQIDAKLAQLGFTAEVSDAIAPLLGLSEQVRDYEGELRNAAGTTDEVANEQLKSLTERFGLLKQQIIETFGDDVLNAIEATANALEGLLRLFKGTQEEIDKQSAVQGALDSIGGQYDSDMSGFSYTALEQELNKLYDTQQKSTEAFNQQNRVLGETIESYSTWAAGVGDSSQKVADATEELKFREFALQKNIEKNQEAIRSDKISAQEKARLSVTLKSQEDRLKSVQEALQSVTTAQEEVTEATEQAATQGGNVDYVRATRKEYEKLLELQRKLDMTDILSGGRQDLANVVTNIGDTLEQLGSSDVIGTHIEKAVSDVKEFNQQLTKLNNDRQAGNISAAQYQERVNKATETYYDNLKQVYKLIEGNLSPEQEKLFKSLFDNFKEGTEQTGDFKTNLDDIADTVDAITNLAGAFGSIGENAKDSLRGISSVLRGVQSIQEVADKAGGFKNIFSSGSGVLSAAVPAIGIAGGVASIANGLFGGDSEEKKQQQELIQETKALKRELARNTEALFQQAIVGSNVSRGDRQRAEQLISGISEGFSGANFAEILMGDESDLSPVRNQLAELGELFPELFGQSLDIFNNLIEQTDIRGAFDLIGGLGSEFGKLSDSVGQFGNSIEGAIERFNITNKLGGDPNRTFDQFIFDVIALIGSSNKATSILNKVAMADSEEERKKLANDLFNAFQQNADLLGPDLTGSDLQEVIDVILGQRDPEEEDTGAEASIPDKYTRSTQVANSITEIQANEIVFFLERIEAWTRSLAANFGDDTAISITQSGGYATSFNIPIPLPVTVEGGSFNGNNVPDSITYPDRYNPGPTIGPFNIQGGLDDRGIDDITRQINRKMKQEVRGARF